MAGKTCERCHRPYYRRNKLEIWSGRNPGHRVGWSKAEIKICNDCLSQTEAQKMVVRMDMRITKTGRVVRVHRKEGRKAS